MLSSDYEMLFDEKLAIFARARGGEVIPRVRAILAAEPVASP